MCILPTEPSVNIAFDIKVWCVTGVALPGRGLLRHVAAVVRGGPSVPRGMAEPVPVHRRAGGAREPIHTRQRIVVQPGCGATPGLRDCAFVRG